MEADERLSEGEGEGKPDPARPAWYARHLVLAPLAVLVMLAGLAISYRIVHAPGAPPEGRHRAIVERIDGTEIPGLNARLAALARAADRNVCNLDRPQGLPPDPAPAPPGAIPPAVMDSLAGRLDRALAVVWVVDPPGSGPPRLQSSGFGFFVSDDAVVTIRSVLGPGGNARVLVGSRHMGRPIEAKVVFTRPNSERSDADPVVLRLARRVPVQPLATVSSRAGPSTPVVIAAYPGVAAGPRPTLEQAYAGNWGAVGAIRLAQGTIVGRRPLARSGLLMEHDARPNHDVVGAPLVDACGRLVGIGTRSESHAIGSIPLFWELQGDGVAFRPDSRPCDSQNPGNPP